MPGDMRELGEIFRLPTNAEIRDENRTIYRTKKFPEWHICMNSQGHSKKDEYVVHKDRGDYNKCPVCNQHSAVQNIIRFVAACPKGHLDNVPWRHIAHGEHFERNIECKNDKYFIYDRGTGNISTIKISCPECHHAPASFGDAYGQSFLCTGRSPENEDVGSRPNLGRCERKMKIIQRHASSLRIPEIKTRLELKFGVTELEKIVDSISETIEYQEKIESKEQFMSILSNMLNKKMRKMPQHRYDECDKCGWEEIKNALDKLYAQKESPVDSNYANVILDEYNALVVGTTKGIPAIMDQTKSEILFEMKPSKDPFQIDNMKFIMSPIPKLSTITVQHGYRREIQDGMKTEDGKDNLPSKIVKYKCKPQEQGDTYWYPGIRSMGEGLFIMLDDDGGYHPPMQGSSHEIWNKTFLKPPKYDQDLFRNPDGQIHEELHPVFVWWHTLSHALMRVMGDEAGYSSAAIRERVFVQIDGNRARGGILLYAAQAGNEGSLGGIISMAPHIKEFIHRAMERIDHCSGDPLCSGYEFRTHSKYNGAACYGCTMNSETSCEHRNMWLDRHILMENPP